MQSSDTVVATQSGDTSLMNILNLVSVPVAGRLMFAGHPKPGTLVRVWLYQFTAAISKNP